MSINDLSFAGYHAGNKDIYIYISLGFISFAKFTHRFEASTNESSLVNINFLMVLPFTHYSLELSDIELNCFNGQLVVRKDRSYALVFRELFLNERDQRISK